jgi:hypothetical protein
MFAILWESPQPFLANPQPFLASQRATKAQLYRPAVEVRQRAGRRQLKRAQSALLKNRGCIRRARNDWRAEQVDMWSTENGWSLSETSWGLAEHSSQAMDTDEFREALGFVACTLWVACVTVLLAFGYVALSLAFELHSKTETTRPGGSISRPVASKTAAARRPQGQRDHNPQHVAHAETGPTNKRRDVSKSFRESDRRTWARR